MGMRVGVDIGGTFIDFCLWDEAKEELHSLKVLTTPQTPGAELMRGLDLLQERHGVSPSEITSFVHGTTVGINTVIQRKGASLALLTTENFEDVVELARLRMPEAYSLFSRRGAPLVPRDRIFGIRERMLADGSVEQPVDEPVVVVEPGVVHPVGGPAGRHHARPGDRETVGVDAELGEQRDVLRPAVVAVARDVTGVAAADPAGGVAERVPDARPAAVGVPAALDLVGRRRGTPDEAGGETGQRRHGVLP